jgi:DNA-binding Xre family transcriptional regulator
MSNLEIRQAMRERRMFNYELAELLGISEFTLSRKLRKELPLEEKERILYLICSKKVV